MQIVPAIQYPVICTYWHPGPICIYLFILATLLHYSLPPYYPVVNYDDRMQNPEVNRRNNPPSKDLEKTPLEKEISKGTLKNKGNSKKYMNTRNILKSMVRNFV